jgi:hypothetical protein
MKFFPFILILLCSCNPYADAKRGIVSGGFMSKVQGFSGTLTTADNATLTWSMVGADATEVPIAGVQALGAYGAAQIAGNVSKFNTANTTAQQANARVPLVTQPASVAPGTTVFPLVTPPSTPVILKP